VNDKDRRLVWSAVGGRLSHHNASVQVFPEGTNKTRIVWTADLLPNEMAAAIDGMIQQGIGVMKKTLDRKSG